MFIQYVLWKDCINNCSFCSLGRKENSSIQDKKIRIQKVIDDINSRNDITTIGFLGGEFFEGQLENIEKEWYNLLETINNKDSIEKIYLYATLINKQYLFYETLQKLKKPYLICTSYDTKGRFHTQEKKANWLKNINNLHNNNIDVFCTIIPTQDFIVEDYCLPDWLNINLNTPLVSVEWYKRDDNRYDYHNALLRDNITINLPKRQDFLKWCIKNKNKLTHFMNFTGTHSQTIYEFDKNNNMIYQFTDRDKIGYALDLCGHPYAAKFYADSDRCVMCDLKEIL